MTQKELLYVEDAVMHEETIIKICQDMLDKISDNNLLPFVNEQLTYHEDIKEKLLSVLKEKANEW